MERDMLKQVCLLMATILIVSISGFVEAAEIPRAGISRPKASLYQIENGGDYLFCIHAEVTVDGHVGKDARLYKGPIEDIRELSVSVTAVNNEGNFDVVTKVGTLSIDKKTWKDKYENVFNVTHLRKDENKALHEKILLKKQEPKPTQAEKLAKAGLSPADVAPKSRLFKVEGLDNKYFFVGYRKATYYEDASGDCKSSEPKGDCNLPREGYKTDIFFGSYPQLKQVPSIGSFYSGASTLGPFHLLLGIRPDSAPFSSLNLLKNQWSDEDTAHKLVHIQKQGNEEFIKKINFNYLS